jgi:F-type H+-transporting ATPase subunit g
MLSAVRQAYESIWDQVSRSGALGKLVRDGEVSAWVGIYGLQAYGIFKVCFRCFSALEMRRADLFGLW